MAAWGGLDAPTVAAGSDSFALSCVYLVCPTTLKYISSHLHVHSLRSLLQNAYCNLSFLQLPLAISCEGP